MRLAALCSGGKDSSFALWLAMQQGHEIKHIVAMIPHREDSWMYHYPNIRLIDLFAECAGLSLIKAETSGKREEEVKDLKHVLEGLDVEGVVSGAIASTYQKSRIDRICRELSLKSIAPLWGREPAELLHEMIDAGFDILITNIAAEGFNKSWLGRKIDEGCIRDLKELSDKFGINISAEGGDYDTLVLNAPFFKFKIAILKAKKKWDELACRGILEIQKAELKVKY